MLGALFGNMNFDNLNSPMGQMGLEMIAHHGTPTTQGGPNLTGALQRSQQYAQAQQQEQQQKDTQSRTLSLLRATNPELAQWVESGAMQPKDAINQMFMMQQEQRKAQQEQENMRFKSQLEGSSMKPTAGIQEYQLARQEGFDGTFMDYQNAKSKGVTVNVGQSEFGTIPPGYELFTDPTSGTRSMKPIAGGPIATEMQGNTNKQKLSMSAYEQKFNLVDSAITDVMNDVGVTTAGPGGYLLSGLPGTSAYDMGKTIETIKANLGFEELQNMRDSSPTGGALGQVTERELAFLQAAQGNLDQAQTPDQLKRVLKDIQDRRRQFREERIRAFEMDYGSAMPAGQSGGGGGGVVDYTDFFSQ